MQACVSPTAVLTECPPVQVDDLLTAHEELHKLALEDRNSPVRAQLIRRLFDTPSKGFAVDSRLRAMTALVDAGIMRKSLGALGENPLPVLQAIWLAAVDEPLLFDEHRRPYFEPYGFAKHVLAIAKKIEGERTTGRAHVAVPDAMVPPRAGAR